MGRTSFLLVVLGLMVSGAMASEGRTRVSFAAGADYPIPTEVPRFNAPSLHLRAVVDAPSVIRKHVPLEAVLSVSGEYDDRFSHPLVSSVPLEDWRYSTFQSGYYKPTYSASATVRIYTVGHRKGNGKPDGLEAGLGLGVHQFFSDHNSWYTGQRINVQHDVQFRAGGFVRLQFAPTQPQGVFLEIEGQRALDDRHQSYLPIASLLATLGFRMHI